MVYYPGKGGGNAKKEKPKKEEEVMSVNWTTVWSIVLALVVLGVIRAILIEFLRTRRVR